MLEVLLQSKIRAQLLEIFFSHEEKELERESLRLTTGFPKPAIERELNRLIELGILREEEGKIFLDQKFLLFPELRDLVLKARLLVSRHFVDEILNLGNIKLFYLTGLFISRREFTHTDMLLIGKIQRKSFSRLIQKYEHDLGKEIYYTILSEKEYFYRLSIGDHFLYTIRDQHPIVIYDVLSS